MRKTLLTAVAVFVGSLGIAQAATLQNGNFDTVDGRTGTWNGHALDNMCSGPGGSWDVYRSLPGSGGDSWSAESVSGIEIQSNRTLGAINAHSGCHYVELDSHPRPGDTTMVQHVDLAAGQYELSFFYSPRVRDENSNGVEFSIFSELSTTLLAGGITGPSLSFGTRVGFWTEVTALFTVDAAQTVKLSFSANADRNTVGGLIDTVTISAVPLPATGVLLLVGIVGMTGLRRRK